MKKRGVIYGFLSGITWALDTVLIGKILTAAIFVSTKQAILLAPLVSTFLHDAASSFWVSGYFSLKGELKRTLAKVKTKSGMFVMLAALLGGPLGMTFYVLAIKYLGSSYAAAFSSVYPAVGAFFAFLFLKDRLLLKNWFGLLMSIIFIILLGYSSDNLTSPNFLLGMLFIVLCIISWGLESVVVAYGMKDGEITPEQSLLLRQFVSAFVYGLVILPVFNGWSLTIEVLTNREFLFLALVALAGSLSYLFYYISIRDIGPTRAMGLNISYSAWAIFLGFLLFGEPLSLQLLFYSFMIIFGSVLSVAEENEFTLSYFRNKLPDPKEGE